MHEDRAFDLLVGVRAEQSLRDAVRQAVEVGTAVFADLELVPVGRKDWIAGYRLGPQLPLRELEQAASQVLRSLIRLDSRQRIRRENVKVWAVQEPVPVFKDPVAHSPNGPQVVAAVGQCPVCNRTVNSYNLEHDGSGNVVGCYLCGAEVRGPGSERP